MDLLFPSAPQDESVRQRKGSHGSAKESSPCVDPAPREACHGIARHCEQPRGLGRVSAPAWQGPHGGASQHVKRPHSGTPQGAEPAL
eukprot:scaffold273_cov242-Pinguiococcus_pyrenoidosus.AAC.30